ncbi:unnamed protein product [marine sediment metagenome]|uniref:Uncharacterized protein n=1 Tax=marine sediment metagenome TaxID=412755 RepID=X0VMD3_9ZZZZ
MPLNKLLYDSDNLFFVFGLALRYPKRKVQECSVVYLQPFLVTVQKCEQGCDGNSLIAILKRMILDH